MNEIEKTQSVDETDPPPKPPYQLPRSFLQNNVKTLLDLSALPVENILCDCGLCKKTQTDQDTSSCRTPPLNGRQATRERFVSHDMFMELLDATAAAFARDKGKQRRLCNPCVLLGPAETQQFMDAEFIDAVIVRLSKDLRASLISVDIEDLEELGWEFFHQDPELQPGDKSDESQPNETREKIPQKSSLTTFAAHFFTSATTESVRTVTPFRPRLQKSEENPVHVLGRNSRAVKAILDAPRKKHLDEPLPPCPAGKVEEPPLLVHIRGYETLSKSGELTAAGGILARFQQLIQSEQESGSLIATIVSSSTLKMQLKFQEALEVAAVSSVAFGSSKCNPDYHNQDRRKTKQQGDINVRQLGRLLRQQASHLIPEKVFTSLPDWAAKETRLVNEHETLGSSLWEANQIFKAHSQIIGRAWRTESLALEDVRIVLCRLGLIGTAQSSHGPESPRVLDAKQQDRIHRRREIESKLTGFETAIWECLVNPDSLISGLDEVVLEEETKRIIQTLVSFTSFRPKASSRALMDAIHIRGALLYGPPGTGKTHLARAVAKDSGSSMLVIDGSRILSKWIGEAEKHIKAVFTLAAKLYPCVIFIDEVDALFYRRSPDDRSWQRSVLTQFLQEIDGISKNDRAPFVLVATNQPKDLDEAFLRRLPQKIQVGLPNEEARAKILKLFLNDEDLDPQVDIMELAKMTKDYSGSDLRNLCGEAALLWTTDNYKSNTSDDNPSAADTRIYLTNSHFERALGKIRPTVSDGTIREFRAFAQRFETKPKKFDSTSPPEESNSDGLDSSIQVSKPSTGPDKPKKGRLFPVKRQQMYVQS